jgi:hypothetical protein
VYTTDSSNPWSNNMSIEDKGKRSLANAQASVENENQKHAYSENEKPGHITGALEHKGEDVQRTEKASSTATTGRHVVSKKDGLQVAAERSAYLESARKEHQKSWDSDKKSVVPERKK